MHRSRLANAIYNQWLQDRLNWEWQYVAREWGKNPTDRKVLFPNDATNEKIMACGPENGHEYSTVGARRYEGIIPKYDAETKNTARKRVAPTVPGKSAKKKKLSEEKVEDEESESAAENDISVGEVLYQTPLSSLHGPRYHGHRTTKTLFPLHSR